MVILFVLVFLVFFYIKENCDLTSSRHVQSVM
ncbi:hypothetical protein T458_09845 [Brevibacillus panacihumi W25]|uniref:Uncharacterized protein n=1 Tax=Brevibacillus panacihumi W25 TaxID=1408254 RepID=V6M938_9BACL|nr:hypothetical protein T458_09845 [Brevibacillus panacihumi W25]